MKAKTKTILSRIANIASVVILAIVLLLTISIITSSGKGYTAIFGKIYFKVASDSMDGEYLQNGEYSENWTFAKNGFKQGDVIVVDVLSNAEKDSLKVGDIITFKMSDGKLNTHRIVQINGSGEDITFDTQGDNTIARDGKVDYEDVIGVYTGKKNSAFAWIFNSINSKIGYILMIVVPTALVLIYCIFLVIKSFVAKNSEKLSKEKSLMEQKFEMEREQMKQELLRELAHSKAENQSQGNNVVANAVSQTEIPLTENQRLDEKEIGNEK